MLAVVLGELAVLAALCVTFMVAHARGPWRHTPAGRHLMAMAAVILAEAVCLFLLGAGLSPPLWVYAVVFGGTDAVMGGWLLLLWRARKAVQQGQPSPPADG